VVVYEILVAQPPLAIREITAPRQIELAAMLRTDSPSKSRDQARRWYLWVLRQAEPEELLELLSNLLIFSAETRVRVAPVLVQVARDLVDR
jgi:hypothetical protein